MPVATTAQLNTAIEKFLKGGSSLAQLYRTTPVSVLAESINNNPQLQSALSAGLLPRGTTFPAPTAVVKPPVTTAPVATPAAVAAIDKNNPPPVGMDVQSWNKILAANPSWTAKSYSAALANTQKSNQIVSAQAAADKAIADKMAAAKAATDKMVAQAEATNAANKAIADAKAADKVAADKIAADKVAADKAAAEAKAALEAKTTDYQNQLPLAATPAELNNILAKAKTDGVTLASSQVQSATTRLATDAQNTFIKAQNAGTLTQDQLNTYQTAMKDLGRPASQSNIDYAQKQVDYNTKQTALVKQQTDARTALTQANYAKTADWLKTTPPSGSQARLPSGETVYSIPDNPATTVNEGGWYRSQETAPGKYSMQQIGADGAPTGPAIPSSEFDQTKKDISTQIQTYQAQQTQAQQQAEQAAAAEKQALAQATQTQANYAKTADWLKTTPPSGSQARLPSGELVYSIPDNPVTGVKGGWYRSVETTPGKYVLQQIGADGAPAGAAVPSADFTNDQQAQLSQIQTYNQQNAAAIQTKTNNYMTQLSGAKTSADVARIVDTARADGITLNQGWIDQANSVAEQTQAQLALKSQQELQTQFDNQASGVRTQADLDRVLAQAKDAGVTIAPVYLQRAQDSMKRADSTAAFAKTLGAPTGQQRNLPNVGFFTSIQDDPVTGIKGGWYQQIGDLGMRLVGSDGRPTGDVIPFKDFNTQNQTARANVGQYEVAQENTTKMNDFLAKKSAMESKLPAPGSAGWMRGGYKPGPGYSDVYGRDKISLIYYPIPPNPATGDPGAWGVSTDDGRTWRPVGQSGVAGEPAGPSISNKEVSAISNSYNAYLDQQSRDRYNARVNEINNQQNRGGFLDMFDDLLTSFDDLVNDTIGWKTIATIAGSAVGGPWGAAMANATAGAIAGEDIGTIAKGAALTFAMSYGTEALGEALASSAEAAVDAGIVDSTVADTFNTGIEDLGTAIENVDATSPPPIDIGEISTPPNILDVSPELDPGAYIPDVSPELDPGAYIPEPVAPVVPDVPVTTPDIPVDVGPIAPDVPVTTELPQPITNEVGEIVGYETPTEIVNNIDTNAPVKPYEPFGPPEVTDVAPVAPGPTAPEIVTNDVGERFVLNPDGTMTPYQDPNIITTPGLPTTEPVLTPVVEPVAPPPVNPAEQYFKDLVDGGMDIKEASDLTDLRFPRSDIPTEVEITGVGVTNPTAPELIGTGPVGPVAPSDLPTLITYGGLQPGEIIATLTPEQIAIMGGSAAALATVTAVISAGGNPATVIPSATATPAPTAPTTTAPTTTPVTPEPVIAPVEPPPVVAPEPVAPPLTPVEPAPVVPPVAPEPVPVETPVIPVVTPPVAPPVPPVPPVEPVPVTPPPVEPVPVTPPPVEPVPVTPPPVEPVPVTPPPVEPVPVTPPPVEPVPVTPPPVEPVPVTPPPITPVEPVPPVETPVTPPVVPPVTPGPVTPPGPVTEVPGPVTEVPGPVTEVPVVPPVIPGPTTPGPTTPGPTTPGPVTPGPVGPTTPGPVGPEVPPGPPGPTTPGPETPVIIPPIIPPVTTPPVTTPPVTEPPVTTEPPKPYEPYEPDYPVQPEPPIDLPTIIPIIPQPYPTPTMPRDPYPLISFAGTNLVNPGLNPGYVVTGVNPPMYQTTNPYQSQYYWGQHPYMQNMSDLARYNQVPGAPAQPFGLQAGPNFDWNQYLAQLAQTPAGPVAPGTGTA